MDNVRIKILVVVSVLSLLFNNSNALAQSETYVVKDLESWYTIEAKAKLTKNIRLDLAQSLRLDNNASTYQQAFTDFSARYRLAKSWNVKSGFRLINEAKEASTKHLRYFVSTTAKYKLSDFTLYHRLMYTNRNELGLSKDAGDDHIKNLRFKTGAKYGIKNWKLDPTASIEIFRRYQDGEVGWNKVRFKLGTELDLKEFGELGAFYAIEKEFGRSIQPTNYIIGLNYSYTFKLYKK